MKKRTIKSLVTLMAAIIVIVAMFVPAYAVSIEEQMAANSAAWWIAYAAGDTATCEQLHQQNEALAQLAAGSTGSANYNAVTGDWNITTANGSTITTVPNEVQGNSQIINYTTTTANGAISSATNKTYTDTAIDAYMQNGGTHTGLENAYNNDAYNVSNSANYGSQNTQNSAAEEVAVAKELLGLTDAQANKLQSDLEASKQAYESAQAAYDVAIAAGDTQAAAEAQALMDAAHAEAESVRAQYNYTTDIGAAEDGGYYDDWSDPGTPTVPTGNGGNFYIVSTHQITASCGEGGTISPAGVSTVRHGNDMEYTITPNAGYVLYSVTVDGVDIGRTTSYAFTNVTEEHTISATFSKINYTISSTANSGGSISPRGSKLVPYGNSVSYTITPNSGYRIAQVLVDGVDVGPVSSYTFNNVSADHSIKAVFEQNTYNITASAGTGGSISPNGTSAVAYGGSKIFTITTNEGYTVSSVIVDGVNKGAMTTYTFSNVKESHTISASFVKTTFQITASAGTCGSISPNGTSTVSYGASKTFTITPNAGYKVENVIIDGVSKGAMTSYTFSNVKATHSIMATFVPSGTVTIGGPTVTDADGNRINGGSVGATIKSGYGIFAEITADYDGVTDIRMVMSYDFGDGRKTVVMNETASGVFEFPVNAQSSLGKRCVYIPVDTADGSYTLTFTLTARNAASELLTDIQTATVTVWDNMYSDDFTGDS